MITDVAARDAKALFEVGREMGRNLRQEIATAPTGAAMTKALADQVYLITSLPREAAERVHKMTTEALSTGRRAADIAGEILETGEVSRNRATLIARTEVSRTASELTAARAQHIDSDGYIWRTVGDADVRPLHRKLNGKFFKWNEPPVTGSQGERSLPGAIYNCRCYPEVVIPERFLAA
jgi:SPP1 gp7 family putative phage head morphogenesis protein